jgi:hypothetical protein
MLKILRNAISHMEDETNYVAMSIVYLGTTLKKKSNNIRDCPDKLDWYERT